MHIGEVNSTPVSLAQLSKTRKCNKMELKHVKNAPVMNATRVSTREKMAPQAPKILKNDLQKSGFFGRKFWAMSK